MNGRVRLAEKPANRILAIPTLKVALVVLELQQFADLLKRNVESGLAEHPQLLFDLGNGRLGGEIQAVVDCQTHAQNYSRLGRQRLCAGTLGDGDDVVQYGIN